MSEQLPPQSGPQGHPSAQASEGRLVRVARVRDIPEGARAGWKSGTS